MIPFLTRRTPAWNGRSFGKPWFGWPWTRGAGGPAEVLAGAAQHQGGRAEQQDRLFWQAPNGGDGAFAMVADGLGGLEGGGLAAGLAVGCARLAAAVPPASPLEAEAHLLDLARNAHRRIAEVQRERGMMCGSTMAAVWVGRDWSVWCHVGDTRVYLIRDGRVVERTRDHSWAQWQVASGLVDECDLATHPDQNKLTQCLGVQATPVPTIRHIGVRRGDALVLATDGVWSEFPDAALAAATGSADPDAAARRLVADAVRSAGGVGDNATAIVLKIV